MCAARSAVCVTLLVVLLACCGDAKDSLPFEEIPLILGNVDVSALEYVPGARTTEEEWTDSGFVYVGTRSGGLACFSEPNLTPIDFPWPAPTTAAVAEPVTFVLATLPGSAGSRRSFLLVGVGPSVHVYNSSKVDPAQQPYASYIGAFAACNSSAQAVAAAADGEGLYVFVACSDGVLNVFGLDVAALHDVVLVGSIMLDSSISSVVFDSLKGVGVVGANHRAFYVQTVYPRPPQNGSLIEYAVSIDLEIDVQQTMIDLHSSGVSGGAEPFVYFVGRPGAVVQVPLNEFLNASRVQVFWVGEANRLGLAGTDSKLRSSSLALFSFYAGAIDRFNVDERGNSLHCFLAGGFYNNVGVRFNLSYFFDAPRAPFDQYYSALAPQDFGLSAFGGSLLACQITPTSVLFGTSNVLNPRVPSNAAELIVLSKTWQASGSAGAPGKLFRFSEGDGSVRVIAKGLEPLSADSYGSLYLGMRTRPVRVARIDLVLGSEAWAISFDNTRLGHAASAMVVDDDQQLLFLVLEHGGPASEGTSGWQPASLVVMDISAAASASAPFEPVYSFQSFPAGQRFGLVDPQKRVAYFFGAPGSAGIVRFALPDSRENLVFARGGVERDQFGFQTLYFDRAVVAGVLDAFDTRLIYVALSDGGIGIYDLERSSLRVISQSRRTRTEFAASEGYLSGVFSWPFIYFGSKSEILRAFVPGILNMQYAYSPFSIQRFDCSQWGGADGAGIAAHDVCRVYFASPELATLLTIDAGNFTVPNVSVCPSCPQPVVTPMALPFPVGAAIDPARDERLVYLASPSPLGRLAAFDSLLLPGHLLSGTCCKATCVECVATPGCGWCHSRKQCLAGASGGPMVPEECPAIGPGSAWSFGSCQLNCVPQCVHGECTAEANGNGEVCICQHGWEGIKCDIAVCGCRCGYCVDQQASNCSCWDGWAGLFCEQPLCSFGCGNGICDAPNHCRCSRGWAGPLCESAICDSIDCHNGWCSGPNTCTCDTGGWQGPDCSSKYHKPSRLLVILLATLIPGMVVLTAFVVAGWYVLYRLRRVKRDLRPALSVQDGSAEDLVGDPDSVGPDEGESVYLLGYDVDSGGSGGVAAEDVDADAPRDVDATSSEGLLPHESIDPDWDP